MSDNPAPDDPTEDAPAASVAEPADRAEFLAPAPDGPGLTFDDLVPEAVRDVPPPPVLSWPAEPGDASPGADADSGDSTAAAAENARDADESSRAMMPTAPDHIQNAALLAPDHWFGLVDSAWTGAWPPPHWAVVGQWRSDAAGRLVEWQRNPEYVRSPAARGWPRPTDPIDAAVQRAAAGYGLENEVPRLVARAEVAVFVRPDGQPVAAVAPDGSPVVPVYTSQHQLDSGGRLAYEIHAVPDLAEWLPEGHALYLNPSAAVAMRVDPEALDQALTEFLEETAGQDEGAPAADPAPVTGVDQASVQEAGPDPADLAPADPDPAGPDPADPRPTAGEADEPVAAAARIETAGSVPAPVAPAPAPTDTAEDTSVPRDPRNTDEPAPAPALGLAESAAAALMAPSGR
ncbi:type VII secretion system-associated protein [Streptomyces sp. NPDC004542]|uniref:type VII secretion system-associated protein n=1 Tax=Streptomyces sp. NPDC004542 TaxID=3154281 RepID=UPI00339E22A4